MILLSLLIVLLLKFVLLHILAYNEDSMISRFVRSGMTLESTLVMILDTWDLCKACWFICNTLCPWLMKLLDVREQEVRYLG